MKTYLKPVLALCTLLCLTHVSPADETEAMIDSAMACVAAAVKQVLAEFDREPQVIVGDITPPPSLKASGQIEMSRSLARHLEILKIKVSDDATTQLVGKFELIQELQNPDDEFESLGMKVTMPVIEVSKLGGFGREFKVIEIKAFGEQVLQIIGATVDIDPQANPAADQRKNIEQIFDPPTKIVANQVRTEHPFGLEILVDNNGRLDSRQPELRSKRAFVELNDGEEYAVRIYNDAEFLIAVELQIDGVNMFVDATDVDAKSKIVVRPGTSATIPGWYITHTKTKAFKISGYEDSVAKRLGSTLGIGTITASIRACWESDKDKPADEAGGTPKGGSKATTQGRDISKNYQQVKADFGKLRSTISIRYDR